MTPVWTWLRKNGSHLSHLRKKNKNPPLPHMLIRPAPALICLSAWRTKQRGRSSVRPFPHRALVGLPRRALPHHWPCRALSLPALLTYAAQLHPSHLRRSLPLRPSPIVVGCVVDPAMAAGAHVPWHLMSSPPEPRAPTSVPVLVVLARRGSLLAPTLTGRINRPNLPSLMLHLYISSVSDLLDICCKCFYLDVAKVDRTMLHMLQVFQRHVASICSKCLICFSRRMLQSFFI
jgi:hypothetical protein